MELLRAEPDSGMFLKRFRFLESLLGHQLAALRAVAIFEGAKGLLVLGVGFGLLSLLHRDAQVVAENLVRHLHLDPASHYPRVFIASAGKLNDRGLWLMEAFALVYAGIRFAEGYGLWHQRRWAEWFGVISGGIYLPFEAYELIRRAAWSTFAIFLANLLIVLYLVFVIMESRTPPRKSRSTDPHDAA